MTLKALGGLLAGIAFWGLSGTVFAQALTFAEKVHIDWPTSDALGRSGNVTHTKLDGSVRITHESLPGHKLDKIVMSIAAQTNAPVAPAPVPLTVPVAVETAGACPAPGRFGHHDWRNGPKSSSGDTLTQLASVRPVLALASMLFAAGGTLAAISWGPAPVLIRADPPKGERYAKRPPVSRSDNPSS